MIDFIIIIITESLLITILSPIGLLLRIVATIFIIHTFSLIVGPTASEAVMGQTGRIGFILIVTLKALAAAQDIFIALIFITRFAI
mmetsp:Transcript_13337/g.16893  ORF Transcript_13337/g.16893 Transcript_13337/m.16893 type:complete len:86 (+) Transcript_13337:2509-2766(+)